MEPHRLRRQPLHRLQAVDGPWRSDRLREGRCHQGVDERGRDRRGGRRRTGDPDAVVVGVRTDARFSWHGLDHGERAHLPRREHHQRRVPRPVPGHEPGGIHGGAQEGSRGAPGDPAVQHHRHLGRRPGLVRGHVRHPEPLSRGDRRIRGAAGVRSDHSHGEQVEGDPAGRLDLAGRLGRGRRCPRPGTGAVLGDAPDHPRRLRVQRERQLLARQRRRADRG